MQGVHVLFALIDWKAPVPTYVSACICVPVHVSSLTCCVCSLVQIVENSFQDGFLTGVMALGRRPSRSASAEPTGFQGFQAPLVWACQGHAQRVQGAASKRKGNDVVVRVPLSQGSPSHCGNTPSVLIALRAAVLGCLAYWTQHCASSFMGCKARAVVEADLTDRQAKRVTKTVWTRLIKT